MRLLLRHGLATCAGLALVLGVAGYGLVQDWYRGLLPERRASAMALATLAGSDRVTVHQAQHWLAFAPTPEEPTMAFVLYPGGFCAPEAYAPVAAALAEQGYLAVIARMPADLAILATDRFEEIRHAYPGVNQWVLGGHSLGGVVALRYLRGQGPSPRGLVLWDSYTDARQPMTGLTLPILSLYSTAHHDPEHLRVFEETRRYLPQHVQYRAIEGGDHFQFGSFLATDIREEHTATISEARQQRETLEATVTFMRALERPHDSGQ